MSEAVRAAVAARRAAAARSRSTSPVKQRNPNDLSLDHDGADNSDSYIQPFGSPKKKKAASQMTSSTDSSSSISLSQKSVEDLLFNSCSSGKLNLSSRLPALTSLPQLVFTLLEGDTPQWYDEKSDQIDAQGHRRPWYEREDLRILSVANGELSQVSERIGDFRGLSKLELQNNSLVKIPNSTFQLVNLTTLNLSRNALTDVPQCLLALDSLVELDMSYNKLQSLWTDETVSQARRDRKEWDEDNADEEGGIWAGFLERAGSPTKRVRPPPPTRLEESVQPMRSLRILKLSNNRLNNAAFFGTAANKCTWPPALVDLDVSDNVIRGPLPVSSWGYLKELKMLHIGGNGISDAVLQTTTQHGDNKSLHPFGPPKMFPSLQVLDLQRCEIDDLAPLEAVFGSKSTVFGGQEDVRGKADGASMPEPPLLPGLVRRDLIRIRQAQDAPREPANTASSAAGIPLCIVVEGNPLREEAYKRKHGTAKRQKTIEATRPSISEAAEPSSASASVAAVPASQPSTSSTPVTSTPVAKEPWELEIEAGMYSEGAKRRMRAEAARAAAAKSSPQVHPSVPSSSNSPSPSRTPARRQHDGINKTGLSDWDGTPSPSKITRGSNVSPGQTHNGELPQQQIGEKSKTVQGSKGTSSNAGGAGSTLANTKLTKRQLEALGRVPCKFFRSANGCSAGEACPFAHVQPSSGVASGGDGTNATAGPSSNVVGVGMKSVCEFFLKGNCRFGHKCALAHVREGEPMSMDRKNKKAAQQSQRGAKSGVPQMQNTFQNADRSLGPLYSQHPQQLQANHLLQHQNLPQNQQPLPSQPHQHFHSAFHIQHQNQQSQRQPQPYFFPNQLHTHPPPTADWPTTYPANGSLPPHEDFSFGLPDDMQPTDPSLSANSGNAQTSGIGQSLHGTGAFSHRAESSTNLNASAAHAHLLGSPPSTRAFGSSPFGNSVFFSGSQDSEGGAGAFARSVGTLGGGGELAPRSLSARPGSFSGSSLRPRMGRLGDKNSALQHGEVEALEEGDSGDTHNEEDFLPSSLSDLLTPAELERRKRNTASQSVPAGAADGQAAFGTGQTVSKTSSGESSAPEDPRESDFDFAKRDMHAPGQSLPHGLAAGLSRMHLAAPSGQDHLTESRGGLAIPSSSSAATRQSHSGQHLSVGFGGSSRLGFSSSATGQLGRTPPRYEFGPVGSPAKRVLVNSDGKSPSSSYVDEYGLGPTAPASVLPHRPGPLSSRLSSAFSFEGRGSGPGSGVSSYSQSPAVGSAEKAGSLGTSAWNTRAGETSGGSVSYASAAGIAIDGNSSATKSGQQSLHPVSAKSSAPPSHGVGAGHRLSLSTSVSASSPLALPPSNAEGEEEVGVFELE